MRNRICKTRIGLGDGLMVTAVAREIARRADNPSMKLFPYRKHYTGLKRLMKGVEYPLIQCETWVNNPLFIQHPDELTDKRVVPYYYYCWFDPPKRGHFIHEMAKPHGIDELDLRGELFLTDAEKERVDALTGDLAASFVAIEPDSKLDWTPNRLYPFAKWQRVVDTLKGRIQFVQVGKPGGKILNNAVDMTGKTTFRETAGIIEKAQLFMASEGGLTHAATAMNTKAVVIITGYQTTTAIGYPQNINISIARHGPCWLRTPCPQCQADAAAHDEGEIVDAVTGHFGW